MDSEEWTSKTFFFLIFAVFFSLFLMSWMAWMITSGELYPSQLRTIFALTKQLFL